MVVKPKKREYVKGDIVGHYVIIRRLERSIGNNRVYEAKCTFCKKILSAALHSFKTDHRGCWKFNRSIVSR